MAKIRIDCSIKLFTLAVCWGYAEKSLVSKEETFTEPQSRVRFLSENKNHLLLSECKTEIERLFVILDLSTCMRYEGLLSLKWSDINFAVLLIVIEITKNGKVGEIPMTADVIELLSSVERI